MRTPKNAFTLIELLVVIAIISLLVSILLPSLKQAKELAKSVKCLSNLRNVGAAFMLYAAEFDDYYVPWRVKEYYYWGDLLSGSTAHAPASTLEYLDNIEILRCPAQTNSNWDSTAWGLVRIGYGYNYENLGALGAEAWQANPWKVARQNEVRKAPGSVYLVMDACADARNDLNRGNFRVFDEGGLEGEGRTESPAARHAGEVNIVFLDGHAEGWDVDPQFPYARDGLGEYDAVASTYGNIGPVEGREGCSWWAGERPPSP